MTVEAEAVFTVLLHDRREKCKSYNDGYCEKYGEANFFSNTQTGTIKHNTETAKLFEMQVLRHHYHHRYANLS